MSKKREDGERALLEKIAEMSEPDRRMAERIHAIVIAAAPELWPKTWYRMPAYAREGKTVVCFFQGADKFEARYATFGFNDAANLDEGNMWPTAFALTELTEAEAARIAELVRKAVNQEPTSPRKPSEAVGPPAVQRISRRMTARPTLLRPLTMAARASRASAASPNGAANQASLW